jgi:hypothetical protein
MENEQVDTVIFDSIDLSRRSKLEHVLKGDGGVICVWFFSNQTGPHSVM